MVRYVLLLCVLLRHGSARTLAPQAAYAQRVARQAAVSAERAAVSAERLARSAATSAKDALDTDNDGMVSTEELEGGIERLWSRCAGIARRASHFYAKYRDACLATGGMLGLLHGGTVAYTILCARAFAATGWPMVRQSVAKMGDAYTAAKREMVGTKPVSPEEYAGMQAQLQEMAAEMEELVGDGASERRKDVLLCQMRALRAELDATAVHRALPVLLAAFEPTLVRDVVLGLWSGLTLSVAAASSAAARSLGIGVSIGEVPPAARPGPVRPLPPPGPAAPAQRQQPRGFTSDLGPAALSPRTSPPSIPPTPDPVPPRPPQAIGASLTEASRRLEVAARRWLRGVSPEAAALSTLGPRRLQRGAISLLSRTLGCWLAVRLQGLAALFSVSLLSAQASARRHPPHLPSTCAPSARARYASVLNPPHPLCAQHVLSAIGAGAHRGPVRPARRVGPRAKARHRCRRRARRLARGRHARRGAVGARRGGGARAVHPPARRTTAAHGGALARAGLGGAAARRRVAARKSQALTAQQEVDVEAARGTLCVVHPEYAAGDPACVSRAHIFSSVCVRQALAGCRFPDRQGRRSPHE